MEVKKRIDVNREGFIVRIGRKKVRILGGRY